MPLGGAILLRSARCRLLSGLSSGARSCGDATMTRCGADKFFSFLVRAIACAVVGTAIGGDDIAASSAANRNTGQASASSSVVVADANTFRARVVPFLRQHCLACH